MQQASSLDNIYVKYIPCSRNKKTGYIGNTYTSGNTCPESCIMRRLGICYCSVFPCVLHWGRTRHKITDLPELLKRGGAMELIRHNIGGDICHADGSINSALLDFLIDTYKNYNAYTYTHCNLTADNFEQVQKANKAGFIVSVSCNTLEQVQQCIANNAPAVLAAYSMDASSKVINDIKYVRCPAECGGTTCKDCKMCARPDRKTVIVFTLHPASARKKGEQHFLKL